MPGVEVPNGWQSLHLSSAYFGCAFKQDQPLPLARLVIPIHWADQFAVSLCVNGNHLTNRWCLLSPPCEFEFALCQIPPGMLIQEERLKEAFERLDVDSSGFISRENLKAVLGTTYDNVLIDQMLKVHKQVYMATATYDGCRGSLFCLNLTGSSHPSPPPSSSPEFS